MRRRIKIVVLLCSFKLTFIHFLLAQNFFFSFLSFFVRPNPCYFLCLETKKVTKENSRLQIILGLLFFGLLTQYNSQSAYWQIAQTVLLTAGLRSKPQNSRFLPKFSEAV
jgi:hypothetical protein